MTSRDTAKSIAHVASDKKAEGIVVLDMRKIVNYCDYCVLCSGNTDRHVYAIADHMDERLKGLGIKAGLKRGTGKSDWIVFDTGDVVTHVLHKRLREFYALEYLWREAKVIDWEKNERNP